MVHTPLFVRTIFAAIVAITLFAPALPTTAWAERDPFSRRTVTRTSNAGLSPCAKELAVYRRARRGYDRAANAYWSAIDKKRRTRKAKARKNKPITKHDYVRSHPPKYTGPRWPKCASTGTRSTSSKPRSTIGVVSDFRRAAKKHYGFVPRHTSERGYKQAYAREALAVGLNAELVVGVYALETGGLGPYARQSGIFLTDQKCRAIAAKGRAASTALGYAQLLAANSAAMTALKGHEFAARLEQRAARAGPARAKELRAKARALRLMARDVKRGIRRYKNRNGWREYVKFSKTSKGYAVHAVNLDADIGPLLQVHKLLKIKHFAQKKGFRSITSAELELMNLVGPGRGAEMMRRVAADAATANFFSRKGYMRNPVAKGLTARQLLGKLEAIIAKKKKKCGSVEFQMAFDDVARSRVRATRPKRERLGLN